MTKARILIVEDEQIVAMDIQNTLESNGFAVVGKPELSSMKMSARYPRYKKLSGGLGNDKACSTIPCKLQQAH
jgi:CheY-like chemotaxis protein